METSNPCDEEVEWQRVKAAILRIDQTTREMNLKLSHLIDIDRDAGAYSVGWGRDGC